MGDDDRISINVRSIKSLQYFHGFLCNVFIVVAITVFAFMSSQTRERALTFIAALQLLLDSPFPQSFYLTTSYLALINLQ